MKKEALESKNEGRSAGGGGQGGQGGGGQGGGGNPYRGRGYDSSPTSPYEEHQLTRLHEEGLDAPIHEDRVPIRLYEAKPKSIVNPVRSPETPLMYSMNPYQGCEHGCVYCYARRSHNYWGFSAGLDFETQLVIKKEAPQLLAKNFEKPSWRSSPIALSGNTDCYQPLERRFLLTRACLEVFLRYNHPVSIITKNALITRDLDLLGALAERRLVHVYLSITTCDEGLRALMEPRTATIAKRFETLEILSQRGIPSGIMVAPVIAGLNDHDMSALLRRAAECGACAAGYTWLRLDDQTGPLFHDWLRKHFAERADKVWRLHGGEGKGRLRPTKGGGASAMAMLLADLFKKAKRKYFAGKGMPDYDLSAFCRPGQQRLF